MKITYLSLDEGLIILSDDDLFEFLHYEKGYFVYRATLPSAEFDYTFHLSDDEQGVSNFQTIKQLIDITDLSKSYELRSITPFKNNVKDNEEYNKELHKFREDAMNGLYGEEIKSELIKKTHEAIRRQLIEMGKNPDDFPELFND